jgi:hypothetical protein
MFFVRRYLSAVEFQLDTLQHTHDLIEEFIANIFLLHVPKAGARDVVVQLACVHGEAALVPV